MKKKKNSKKLLISYCGICCSLCPGYKSTCPGCPQLKDCKIVQCGKERRTRYCFSCKEFPCKLFIEGFDWDLDKIPNLKKHRLGTVKWKPYSKEYIKLFTLNDK